MTKATGRNIKRNMYQHKKRSDTRRNRNSYKDIEAQGRKVSLEETSPQRQKHQN